LRSKVAWRVGLLSGVVTLVAALVLGAGAGSGAAAAQTVPQQKAKAPTITLQSQSASVAPEGTFAAYLRIVGAPPGSELAVDIYDRATTAAAMDTTSSRSGAKATFPVVPLDPNPSGAAQTSGFAIMLFHAGQRRPPTSWAHRIDKPGVYPVRVRLRDADKNQIATFTTALIRDPAADEPVTPAKVAVLATVHQDVPADPVARAASDEADPRLGRALPPFLAPFASHPNVPVSFSVTPDTAARLAGDPAAAPAADALRVEVSRAGRTLLDAPFVDVDPTQLVSAGREEDLAGLRDLGRTALTDVLAAPTPGTWVLRRPVDGATLDALRRRGIFRVVLPADGLKGSTPDRAVLVPAGGAEEAVVTVETGPTSRSLQANDPTLAAHDMLARLTLVAGAEPGAGVVLPLDAVAARPASLVVLLDALAAGNPAYRATTLDDVFTGAGPLPSDASLSQPRTAPLGDYGEVARDVAAALASYRSMDAPTPGAASVDASGVDRFARPLAFSAAMDLSPAQRLAELRAVRNRLQDRFRAVTMPAQDKVTLGSRHALFPLPIKSTIKQPTRVLVQLEANDRLDFRRDQIEVTLTGDRTVTEIPVSTRTSGDTPVRITVRSPDGRVVLAESRYTIRSTAVSGVGVILTIGAAAFLALWWGRHLFVARRSQPIPRRARSRQPSGAVVESGQ